MFHGQSWPRTLRHIFVINTFLKDLRRKEERDLLIQESGRLVSSSHFGASGVRDKMRGRFR